MLGQAFPSTPVALGEVLRLGRLAEHSNRLSTMLSYPEELLVSRDYGFRSDPLVRSLYSEHVF